MEQAAAAMKQIHGKLTPEKVDETMDNLREQNALGDEIAQSMNSVNIGNEIDDAELDAELDDLQQEQVDGQMPKMSHTTIPNTLEGGQTAGSEKLPDVPTMTEDEEVEAELRQLEMA